MRTATRSLFLQSGLQLYPQYGYHRLSVRRLAAATGLSPGMFHHLFANKDAFIGDVLRHKYDSAFAELILHIPPHHPVISRLHHALRFVARFVRDNLDWIHRIFADSADGVTVVNHFIRDNATRHVSLFLTLFAEGEAAALFVAATPVQRFTFLMGAVITPMIIGTRLQSADLLPQTFAGTFSGSIMSDDAIEERINWAISAILRKEPQ